MLTKTWTRLVRAEPGATAVVDPAHGTGAVSRGQLEAMARAWVVSVPDGEQLRGRRLAMAMRNGPAWFEVFLGALYLGAVPVLLDPGEPLARQLEQADGLGCSWLWSGGQLHPLTKRRRERRAGLCLFKVTSGSTGRPKGLPFTEGQIEADGRQICAGMGIRPDDLNLAVIPLGHSYGLGNLVMPLLLQGTPVLFADSPLPSHLAEVCARWRPTVFPGVPTLFRALLRSEVQAKELASLRLVISAGAPLSVEEARQFHARFDRKVHNFYGSSETGGITYDTTGEASLSGRSVGAPLPGVRLVVGSGGRFKVQGAAVLGKGVHSPADLGRLTEDGELRLEGRLGRQVKLAGRRLDLAGLEAELGRFPGVRGVVAALYSGRRDVLSALIASDLGAAELKALFAGRIAGWRVPGRILVVPELPHTARGKVDRAKAEALLNASAH